MKIIGFNYDMMISSLCLLNNNKIDFSISEERLSREKNTRKFPRLSLENLLQKKKLKLEDIDYFVSSYNPGILLNKFNPILSSNRRHFSEHLSSMPDNILSSIKDRDKLRSLYSYQEFPFSNYKLKVFYVNHHDAHAANAYYQSNFSKALVFVFDLQGEISSTSVYKCKNGKFDLLEKIEYPNSVGMLYATITEYLGFKANSDEWKVMAISNLSKISQKFYNIFREKIIRYDDNGNYDLNLKLFNGYYPVKPKLYNQNLLDLLGNPNISLENPSAKQQAISSALQKVTYDVVSRKINYFAEKTNIKNICGVGGVFMNCLMNGKLEREFNNYNFYIPYAPDDSGNSIGAAIYLSKNILKNKSSITNINNPYLGSSFQNDTILSILKKYKISFKESENIATETAKLLAEGKIIGWFQGKSEFGQRALGNRSILANPKIKNVKKILNEAVKYREGFRPFAPAIVTEKFTTYFESQKKLSIPFMEKIYYLKKKYKGKLSSICHKDGSCRVQTVSKTTNDIFFRLLIEFEKIEKVPILINTSFNIKGEPIVNNPQDALSTFYKSGLDFLVLGNYIVKK